jgi:hypothetical protein
MTKTGRGLISRALSVRTQRQAAERINDGADLKQHFPALMDKATLARLLGINPKTLDRRAASGMGPARIKIGQKIWFRREAVIEWLLAN